MKSIAIGGSMGAGKSTVGQALAERLGWTFIDMDSILESRFGPIADQFATDGEATFRQREADLVREITQPRVVVATGGGVFARRELREVLRAHCTLVTLDVTAEMATARVGSDPGRPLGGQVAELLAQRRADYLDVDVVLDGARPVAELVDALVPVAHVFEEISVKTESQSYPVRLVPRLADALGPAVRAAVGGRSVVLVTEENVGPLWASVAEASLMRSGVRRLDTVVIPAGEAHKTVTTWSSLQERLLSLGVDRKVVLIALGGGVLGDIVGFSAATLLRGVDFIQVPTTTLAMADSSVGGKTGVNAGGGKNLVGAFHQPISVVAAMDTLSTLPLREHRCGLAEIVKAALLDSEESLQLLEASAREVADRRPAELSAALSRAIGLKSSIVSKDERESGIRGVLNFGHTVGHALESALGHGALGHGEAVAVGMVMEIDWAAEQGYSPPSLGPRVERLLRGLGLPTELPEVSKDLLVRHVLSDKKRNSDVLRIPILDGIGEVRLMDLPVSRVEEFFIRGSAR